MSNPNRGVIERQDAKPALPCASCARNGLLCSGCHKLFVVGDLRVRPKGPDSASFHLACRLLKPTRGVALPHGDVCDAVLAPEGGDLGDDADRALAKVGAEIAAAVNLASDGSLEQRLRAEILASGWLSQLRPERPDHFEHIGSVPSDDVCDFCSSRGDVAGRLPCAPFSHATVDRIGSVILPYEGDWNYCAGCKPHVEKKDHVALARRAMRQPAQDPDPLRRAAHFEGLYRKAMGTAHG